MEPVVHDESEVTPHLERMLEESIANGLPEHLHARMRNMLYKYREVFRLKLGSDAPVKVPPMRIKLKEGAESVRVKVRRYPPAQADFLKKKVVDLETLGLVKRNTESSWGCAPLIVPKDGPEQFRFTVDLRPVNQVTEPFDWPMPELESVIAKLAGAKCFATIDLSQGFWQFPIHVESQEYQSFITPDGVYTPTRVLHGRGNASGYCQSSVELICESILNHLLIWIDDILKHAKDADTLLDVMERLFKLCVERNLKLHAKKCKLFLMKVRWCGRIVSGEDVQMDPSRLQALVEMPAPSRGDELQQFVCAAIWDEGGHSSVYYSRRPFDFSP